MSELQNNLHEAPRYEPKPLKPAPGDGRITSPLPGTVIRCLIKQGDRVRKGDTVMLLEAMKMANEICAPFDGTVVEVCVTENETVPSRKLLCVIKGEE